MGNEEMNMTFQIEQLGVIHSPFKRKEDCPIQGAFAPEARGTIDIYAEYAEGLETIETFSHIILFYIFDRAGEIMLSRPTFLDDASHGVFASRHPCRPNHLGTSIVKLEGRRGNVLEVSGIDVLDNTPLVDMKPYVPKFDYFVDANSGWVADKEIRRKPPGRE